MVPYFEKREERVAELAQHMVNLCIQFIRAVEWTPSLEDRVSNLEDAIIYRGGVRREAGNEVLL